jgi:homogentisate 1,2-dioxygenase
MFESRWTIQPTRQAMDAPIRQRDYDAAWAGLTRHFR